MGTVFALVALGTWLATVLVGFVLADRWVTGVPEVPVAAEAPEPRIGATRGITLGAHIAPAATSLLIWAAYVMVGGTALAWAAVGVMAAGIAFGAVLFAIGHRRRTRTRRPVPRPVVVHATLAGVTLVLAVTGLLL